MVGTPRFGTCRRRTHETAKHASAEKAATAEASLSPEPRRSRTLYPGHRRTCARPPQIDADAACEFTAHSRRLALTACSQPPCLLRVTASSTCGMDAMRVYLTCAPDPGVTSACTR